MENVEVVNRDISNGRLIPAQIVQIAELFLATFTIVTTAMKIPYFGIALKAGVTAEMFITIILNQVWPQFGCLCAFGMIKCSPVYRSGMYQTENECTLLWYEYELLHSCC
jgi:hypothetical protein